MNAMHMQPATSMDSGWSNLWHVISRFVMPLVYMALYYAIGAFLFRAVREWKSSDNPVVALIAPDVVIRIGWLWIAGCCVEFGRSLPLQILTLRTYGFFGTHNAIIAVLECIASSLPELISTLLTLAIGVLLVREGLSRRAIPSVEYDWVIEPSFPINIQSDNARRLIAAVCGLLVLCAYNAGRRLADNLAQLDLYVLCQPATSRVEGLAKLLALVSMVFAPIATALIYCVLTWLLYDTLRKWTIDCKTVIADLISRSLKPVGVLVLTGVIWNMCTAATQFAHVHLEKMDYSGIANRVYGVTSVSEVRAGLICYAVLAIIGVILFREGTRRVGVATSPNEGSSGELPA
jgi:hypothetical protein